jgi:hypothetical protein
MKPELLAHAIWIAAPILPGTREQTESETLHHLLKTDDKDLVKDINKLFSKTQLDHSLLQSNDPVFIREMILHRIRSCKYISPHYMHVDGTSFAAPIVSATIAQLLEINPSLTPAMIRELLFATAKRIDDIPAERQGFGVIEPRKAILKVLKKKPIMKSNDSPFINKEKKTIEFYVQNDCASQICLAGSFNHWAQDVLLMEPGQDGVWKIEIPMLPDGRYQYKFFVDDKKWTEDFENPYREPDGFRGFNSILTIGINDNNN